MNTEKSHSRSFLLVVLAIPIVASMAVACGTFLTPPAPTPPADVAARSQAPTPASAATDTPQPPPLTPTVAPTSTPQPPPPTPTHTTTPPADTPTRPPTAQTQEGEAGSMMANAQHGQELFNSLGCIACHGPQGEGAIGPTIAQTELPLARVIRQYRAPYQSMPRFGPDQVSESDIADIYAYLHTLPTPQEPVPSVLANVTPETGIGTIRGTIVYGGTGRPAADEQIYVVPVAEKADGSLTFSYLAHLPAGTTDAGGRFEIADVEAQLYGVFYTRQEAPVLDADGNIVLVNVLPGEVAEIEGLIPSP
ncbi:MAG: c-type cytochrome [Anaerolineae bacterium]